LILKATSYPVANKHNWAYLVFEMTDSGKSLSQEDQENIFKPCFNVKHDT